MLTIARRVFRVLQSMLIHVGFELRFVGRVPASIPQSELYRPYFQPWQSRASRERLRHADLRSHVTLDRKYVLDVLLDQALKRNAGAVAECGVYRGGTAILLAARAQAGDRPLHLFDTFAGMPPTDPERDLHREHDFADTTLGDVRAYLSDFACVVFHPGFIPGTLAEVAGDRFAFVHIDLDIYDAIKSATAFFYDRLERGGIIVYDDYGLPSCPGARLAVDEFFAERPEVPLVLATGQSVVTKL